MISVTLTFPSIDAAVRVLREIPESALAEQPEVKPNRAVTYAPPSPTLGVAPSGPGLSTAAKFGL